MFLSELGRGSESESHSVCPILCDVMDYRVHGIIQGKILEWVAIPSPGDLPNPDLLHCRWILYQLSYQEEKDDSKSPENQGYQEYH